MSGYGAERVGSPNHGGWQTRQLPSSPLRSCPVVPLRRNPDRVPVFADEHEVVNEPTVTAGDPMDNPARNLKPFTIFSLSVLHPNQGARMANTKTTGSKAATAAAKTIQSKTAGSRSKTAAGSALSQTGAPNKQTSSTAATAASKVLRDGRTSAQSKSGAASALAQAKGKK